MFLRNEKGQGIVEYVLIIALVVVIAIAAVNVLGNGVKSKANAITLSL